ncbi:MAG: PQQ-dependent sugar dehydrogenase [Chitinophagaceae bacterium]|nr:PQQ-dependent sugar dehydrogenase [Chitinophagaceae bacterium]
MMKRIIPFLLVVILAFGCEKDAENTSTDPAPPPLTGTPTINVKTLLTGQGTIWGFDFLPDGNVLFSQKTGSLRIYDTTSKTTASVNGLPTNISAAGQGGMLDVCVAPATVASGYVYISYSITGGFLRLARFTLNSNSVSNFEVLHTTESSSTWNGHYGSRLQFGRDGKLYWSVGEGGGGSLGGASSPHQNGQLLTTFWGKIHRMNPDGSVPADNPLIGGNRTTIFSYGHRNPQGMAFEPATQRLFSTEHGPNGGCELNLIEQGRNYGWPIFSTGNNYNGSNISGGNHNSPGITVPLKSWTPALAPSGLTFINHPSYRDWNGNMLAGSLGRRHLLMISMKGGVPGEETVLLENTGRVRNVKQGPLGKIYVSVEEGGRLLELTAQ